MDRYTVYELTRTTATHGRSVFGGHSPPAGTSALLGNRRTTSHYGYSLADSLPSLSGCAGLLPPSHPGSVASSRSERPTARRGSASACSNCSQITSSDPAFGRNLSPRRRLCFGDASDRGDPPLNRKHPRSSVGNKASETGQVHSARRYQTKGAGGGFSAVFPASRSKSKS